MTKAIKKSIKKDDPNVSNSDKFPRIVMVIILAEFCERFSFSGMKAFLTLYLRSKLGYTDEGATETYHIFSTFVYVFPIIGGILADNYLGKFRTILYMMFVYAAGNLLVSLTAIPQLALPARACTLIGLFLITVGTGGIKPCVAAFGGDQFILPQQEKHLAIYFSILYFTLCMGSLIAKTVSPILRAEVQCFGDKDCYSLAFGAPGLVVLTSIVIFVSAKKRYVMKKPEGNVLLDFVTCVTLGIKNVLLKRHKNEKCSHWLDTTQHRYDKRFIKDAKKTLSILMLFTILPFFWALLDQMGSRWTLQATKMDGRFGFITVKPDQMQVLSPIFILIMIPIAQKYIYPFLERRNILKNPLHKLILGGVLAGVAMIASGVLELYLKTTYPVLPKPGYSQMRIFNGNQCSISIENSDLNIAYTIPSLSHTVRNIPSVRSNITFTIAGGCFEQREEIFKLEDNRAVSFFLTDQVVRFVDKVEKSKSGFPVVRFLKSNPNPIILYNELRSEIETEIYSNVSKQLEVFTSTYTLLVGNRTVRSGIQLESGGVYTIAIDNSGSVSEVIVITQANSISMALVIPQYIIMSAGEVLYAVTGNEFAFKESPDSMKAVMISAWLLTEAMGNVIIIVITRLFVNYQQETQSFIYSGLMFLSMMIFYYMSRGYEFGFGEDDTKRKDVRRQSEILYLRVRQTEECLDH